jgi:NADPH:quinone reductase-like Zn-dependent oxidoreductase
MGTPSELLAAAEGLFDGTFVPVVDRTFPLAEAGDAHRALESSRHFGKIVLLP